jgi:hypothetical protein
MTGPSTAINSISALTITRYGAASLRQTEVKGRKLIAPMKYNAVGNNNEIENYLSLKSEP